MKYSRSEYAALADALNEAAIARACISQNRGPDKEEARQAYEYAIAETVVPALSQAIDTAAGDLDARDVERLADAVLKMLIRKGVAGERA